jgi:hypothetical protein
MIFALAFTRLAALNQSGVDEQPVESPRLGAAGAGVEQAIAALKDLLLLGEGESSGRPAACHGCDGGFWPEEPSLHRAMCGRLRVCKGFLHEYPGVKVHLAFGYTDMRNYA